MGRQNIMTGSMWWSKLVHLMVGRRRERKEGSKDNR
jgi:hypothetical protein